MLELSLIVIILLVLFLPLSIHLVERNLEPFLLAMGVLAVSFNHVFGSGTGWSWHLMEEALKEPVMITCAVLVFGLVVYYYKNAITRSVAAAERLVGARMFAFLLITVLGAVSSVITAIIASIILVEIINTLNLDKKFETKLVVIGCFSIGLGAVLTPIGEPLSTIAIAKLKGEPYHADFFFLFRSLAWFILPGILFLGILGSLMRPPAGEAARGQSLVEKERETLKGVFVSALKVYVFVMALIFLGSGFKPIIDTYIIKLPSTMLYWINTVSAILDNATLAAAEVSPKMSLVQIQYVLMGLLVSGGMLIPGNIPNIISAGRLSIKSKEWAKLGVPLGFFMMLVYFVVLILI